MTRGQLIDYIRIHEDKTAWEIAKALGEPANGVAAMLVWMSRQQLVIRYKAIDKPRRGWQYRLP